MPAPKDEEEGKSFGYLFPFLEYASTHFLDYAEAAEGGHVNQTEFLRRLREEHCIWERVRLFHNSFKPDDGSGCMKGASPLYMSAAYGYDNLVRTLLDNGTDVNARGGYYGTALQAAAYKGHDTIVATLLKNKADVNALGGYYGMALQAAAAGGSETIVATLLENRADVNEQSGFYGTALQAAAYMGHDTIVATLLENKAEVNTQGGLYGTAVQAAAVRGRETILATLLENKADDNAEDTASHSRQPQPRTARQLYQGCLTM